MAQWVRLLLVDDGIPYQSAGLNSDSLPVIQVPANALRKAEDHGPSAWIADTHKGDQNGVPKYLL